LSEEEVSRFLTKCKIAANLNFELEFNKKNKETISILGFTIEDVKTEILNLKVEDFISGHKPDYHGYKGYFWEFGKIIQNREIYIKIKIKDFNSDGDKQYTNYCISFHFAEQPLVFQFK
jgi:hypothetical protein